jgi:hypothetical protein
MKIYLTILILVGLTLGITDEFKASEVTVSSNQWGPFKPQLYFAVTERPSQNDVNS